MTIFITGATGFIGTHFIRRIARGQHRLRCLARPASRTETLREVGAEVVVGDVTNRQSLADGMRGCDWVVNLANFFEFWAPGHRVYHDVNVAGTRNVMETAIAEKVSKVVHVSTVAVYGNAKWPITEASELGIQCPSEYARTKRAGDEIAWELYRKGNLPLVVIYPAGVLGPDDDKAAGRYVSNLVRGKMPAQILTRRVFPWVDVRDVAEAIARALEKDGNIGEKYLLAAENLTFGDFNRTLAELSGMKLPGMTLPDSVTVGLAYAATGLANLTKKPPMLDLAIDQILMMKQGFQADGTRAARELGFSYTPIRLALQDEVRSVRRVAAGPACEA